MITFKEYFENQETAADTIAILPGGFKPPTRGHFLALKDLLEKADRGIVYVGKTARPLVADDPSKGSITQQQSKAIWDIYKNYFNKPLEIIESPISPVKDTYDFALENDDVNIIVGAGGPRKLKDGKMSKGDMKRYESFTKNKEKYPHVTLKEIESKQDIKGDVVREKIVDDIDVAIKNFFPDVLNETDKAYIKEILDYPGRGLPEEDAEYRGRKVTLNKPTRGDVKKFKVYVKDPKTGNIKKVNFGHGGTSAKRRGEKTMKIRKSNPKARKSFRARHNCDNPGPKTKARYWSCKKW